MNKRFGTALNCIDGRTQLPVIEWMSENFDLDYIDLITEPGMDAVLSQGQQDEIEAVREKVIISITAHDSNVVAVIGHYDCAANPVSDYEHFQDITESVDLVRAWDLPVTVIGLWVEEFGCVHLVCA